MRQLQAKAEAWNVTSHTFSGRYCRGGPPWPPVALKETATGSHGVPPLQRRSRAGVRGAVAVVEGGGGGVFAAEGCDQDHGADDDCGGQHHF